LYAVNVINVFRPLEETQTEFVREGAAINTAVPSAFEIKDDLKYP